MLTGLVVLGLSRIRFDANVLSLLPQDLVEVRGLDQFLRYFGLPGELIVTIEAEDSTVAEALAASLATSLRDSGECTVRFAAPWMQNPAGLAELAAYALINQPPELFQKTLEKLQLENARAAASEAIEQIAITLSQEEIARHSYDPLGLVEGLSASSASRAGNREFSSQDGKIRLLYVTPSGSTPFVSPPRGWPTSVTNRIREWQAVSPENAAATVGWTGEPAFVNEISTAMERDMRLSSIGALLLAALLFYGAYRRFKPLVWMMLYVTVGFIGALGFAALVYPGISIISVGFAAILVGLTVDYGFLIYQRRVSFNESLAALRAATGPSIIAAACTTAVAFLSLNLSGLPGIAQLGTTVAIGVLLGAFLMLRFFAANLQKMSLPPPRQNAVIRLRPRPLIFRASGIAVLLLALLAIAELAIDGFPPLATDTHSMRPRNSMAYPTLDRVTANFGNNKPALNLVVPGSSERDVGSKLALVRPVLDHAQADGVIAGHELPDALWPDSENQKANLVASASIGKNKDAIRGVLSDAGFTDAAALLVSAVLDRWVEWSSVQGAIRPAGDDFQWISRRTMRFQPGEFVAGGLVTMNDNATPDAINRLADELATQDIFLTSWNRLGAALSRHATGHGVIAGACFLIVLAAALFISFRNLRETLLALGTTILSLIVLNGLMRLLSLEWNFLNLCSLTLTIGIGVDYSIHMIFALRESRGCVQSALQSVGKALCLCAATTIAGFASLSTAQTIGLASIGTTCALGIAINLLVTLFLLPPAWRRLFPNR